MILQKGVYFFFINVQITFLNGFSGTNLPNHTNFNIFDAILITI